MIRLSELRSSAQTPRPTKAAVALPDDIITQREEDTTQGSQVPEGCEARVRRRLEEKEKARGRRQRDFEEVVAPQAESSDEEEEPREQLWTQGQQRLLELALQQYPRGAADRWDRIARCVPAKSKVGAAQP